MYTSYIQYTWILERTLSVCKISALRADFLWRSWKWSFFDYCGQFWISYLLGWSYSTLRKNVSVFQGGNSREKGGNTRADSSWLKNENMKWWFFLEMVIFVLKWANLQKMDRHETKICPGKKFVTNEYPGIYSAGHILRTLVLEFQNMF